MNVQLWSLDRLLDQTYARLTTALEIVEAIDDPYPGVDLIAVATALGEAIALVDVLIAGREICAPPRSSGSEHSRQ
jgi:hypothetical protein